MPQNKKNYRIFEFLILQDSLQFPNYQIKISDLKKNEEETIL